MIEQVILLGLDDVALIGIPRHLYVGRPDDLWKPDAIIVDKVGLRKLFPGQGGESARTDDELNRFLGRELEMNDCREVIVGVCETTRTFQSNPVVYSENSIEIGQMFRMAHDGDSNGSKGHNGRSS